jgi:uncharacterized DUF497 family protein
LASREKGSRDGPDYEWDEAKRAANLAKHRLDFDAIRRFNWDGAVMLDDYRHDYGERRLRAYGTLDGRYCVVVFTVRDEKVRVISLRRIYPREIGRHGR